MVKLYLLATKSANLITYLFNYSSPNFRLNTIDFAVDPRETLIIFIETKTKQLKSKTLYEIYNNKLLLNNFSSIDAFQIGYTYGRLITINSNPGTG
jgi:hypothetical protein